MLNDPLLTDTGTSILPEHDRLSFIVEIQALGLVLVGSPIGSVAMISLTKTRRPASQSDEKGKRLYTLSYDYNVDLLNIRKHFAHVFTPPLGAEDNRMVGMAASPIQRLQDANGEDPHANLLRERTWRLMLLYEHHTMVSFRLRRSEGPNPKVI